MHFWAAICPTPNFGQWPLASVASAVAQRGPHQKFKINITHYIIIILKIKFYSWTFLNVDNLSTNWWKSGKNEDKIKWVAEGWKLGDKMSHFSSPLFPLSTSPRSYKTTFESAVLTTKIMKASTCQRNTSASAWCLTRFFHRGPGWKAGIGKMRFLCEGWHAKKEKRVDAPTPSISEFQFCPWFSPLLRVSSLRFILLPNLRRRRLFSFSVVSQHFGVPCAQKLILASDVGDWISLSSSFDVGTRYVITMDDWSIFIDQMNTLCVCLEWRCTSRRGRTQFFFLGIRFELGTPSLATCRPTHFMVGETQKRLREADRPFRLPWLHCRCPPASRRPSSGCKTLLAIQFSIADDWVVTGQLALSNPTLQR